MPGKISYFQSLPEGGKPHVCSEVITIDDFILGVKYGKWKHFIEPIRQEPDKAKRDRLKRNIPSVTIGGVFKERQQDKLIEHSGFICVDIDKFNDKSALLSDPYTYALFQSASGGGIAVIVRVNPDKHKEAYRWLEHYYYATFGISVDPAPKNVASLRYVSFDPEIFVNTRSLQSRTKAEKPRKPQSLPVILPTNAVEEMISQVVSSRIDLAPDYDSYLRLGFAIASGFGETGRTYFHQLCHISDKYHSAQADKQYDWCLSGASKSGVSVGTFYFMLKDAGIKIPKVNEKAVQVAALAKKSGRTKDGVAATLVEVQNIDPVEARNIAEQVFDRDDIDLSKVAKDPDQLITSLVEWIRQNHPVRVNSITRMIEESGTEVKKERMNTIYLRARMCFNSKEITKDLVESIIFSDMIHEFNPVTEYIDRNRKRNSSGNIDALIRTIHTDTPNAELWIKKWLVSLIAAYEGSPVRIVLALVGGQNTGKCLAKGTKVMMYDGSTKNAEEILQGDELMGINGEKRTVLSTTNGREQMYEVVQKNGDPYTVNESHILSLKNRITGQVKNISVKEYVSRYGRSSSKWRGYKSTIRGSFKNLKVDPYLLGVWLGDGKSDLSCGVMIESMKNEVVDYLMEYCKTNGLFLSKYTQEKSKSDSYNIVSSFGSGTGKKDKKNLKHTMIDMGVSKNKHIPIDYKLSSEKQRLELLAGIIDTDGFFGGHYYEIIQRRKTLAYDIVFLCRSLGFKTTVTEKSINMTTYYRVYFSGDLSVVPVRISYKKCLKKNRNNALLTDITVIKKSVDDYYGFEIDGDKLFLLGDFTVTHNTEWFRRLLPGSLSKYYAESKLDSGKDDEILMTQKLIVMDDEMGGKSKHDEKRFKELTSKSIFSLRAPYGRYNEDFKRLAVLCGTSNDQSIINDPTGNTRILPVRVLGIDHEAYNAIDKDELFMECVRLHESGFDWQLTKNQIIDLGHVSGDYETIPFERELIQKFFKSGETGGGYSEWLTSSEIKDYIETHTAQKIGNLRRFGIELVNVLGQSQIKSRDGISSRCYCIIRNKDPKPSGEQDLPF